PRGHRPGARARTGAPTAHDDDRRLLMADPRRETFRSMGTDVAVIGPGNDERFATVASVVHALFDREDRRFSRFRADSELSFVNASAGSWTRITPEFASVVRLALAAWRDTDGRFDPTVLDAVIAAGYDRDFDELLAGARGAVRPGRPCGRVDEVILEGDRLLLPEDVGLDFGGIAKGWTVDVAAEMAITCGLSWVLVNAGGDLRVAGALPQEGIRVAVDDPEAPDREAGRIVLGGGALATSSVTRRAWGDGLHHLIDPATGRPAAVSVLQATAWAATCAEAEVRAKQALLEGESYLERRPGLLVFRDGRIVTNLTTSEEAVA
ncbi:MAG: FAD:protein FMN transferase, partial [Actinomycetota bacterium]